MATSSSDMKGFFKQKKNIAKKKPTSTSSSSKSISNSPKTFTPTTHAASTGSNTTQPTTLISHGFPDLNDDHDKNEDVLRQFDMDMKYGPCLGMTRFERFNRAMRLGLNPPNEIESLLNGLTVRVECLWDGRV